MNRLEARPLTTVGDLLDCLQTFDRSLTLHLNGEKLGQIDEGPGVLNLFSARHSPLARLFERPLGASSPESAAGTPESEGA